MLQETAKITEKILFYTRMLMKMKTFLQLILDKIEALLNKGCSVFYDVSERDKYLKLSMQRLAPIYPVNKLQVVLIKLMNTCI